MADPILSMSELLEGDPTGHLRQNDRNLVMARLAVLPTVTSDALTTPPGSVARGEMFILGGAGTGDWAGRAVDTVAIALSADPSTSRGWFFLTPGTGLRVWILAGTDTGHRVWDGAAWAAV
jgi:hypothetical protein